VTRSSLKSSSWSTAASLQASSCSCLNIEQQLEIAPASLLQPGSCLRGQCREIFGTCFSTEQVTRIRIFS
jgi:hypothetical protein